MEGCLLLRGAGVCRGVTGGEASLITDTDAMGVVVLAVGADDGMCETDDVICNTVGCGTGAVSGSTLSWLIGMVRNK